MQKKVSGTHPERDVTYQNEEAHSVSIHYWLSCHIRKWRYETSGDRESLFQRMNCQASIIEIQASRIRICRSRIEVQASRAEIHASRIEIGA
jgi:hypothetical protein